ncbi:hypothetical protein TNCV_2792601 [Trichonephila clavipes]|nr:hypothetical protein TNCV_2792601 [Trichonephila clavipes]
MPNNSLASSIDVHAQFLLSYPQELRLDNHGLELKRGSSHFLGCLWAVPRLCTLSRKFPAEFPVFLPLVDTGTATAGSDAVQSGRPIFDDFFQHLWPYIGHKPANVVFQMVKRLWLIRIDQ